MPQINFQQLIENAANFGSDEDNHETATAISWQSSSCTDIGRVRHINEDAFLDAPEKKLWVVADGMGGLSRGDYASKAVVSALKDFSRLPSITANIKKIETQLISANDICRSAFRGKRLGTTVAALFAFGDYCFYIWAGDSRIYRLRDNNVEQMTEDHTVAQEKYLNGEIKSEEIEDHPSSNVLTRAVGVHRALHLDMGYEPVKHGDRFLICSDGLYNDLELSEIKSLLKDNTAENALNRLVTLAIKRGGQDNITGIVVDASAIEQ